MKDEGRGCFGTEREEDSLFTNSELAIGAVSSILRDSDLRRADAMYVEDVLVFWLQGAAIVCSVRVLMEYTKSAQTLQSTGLKITLFGH